MHFNRESLSAATTERTTRALIAAQAAESERHRREALREVCDRPARHENAVAIDSAGAEWRSGGER